MKAFFEMPLPWSACFKGKVVWPATALSALPLGRWILRCGHEPIEPKRSRIGSSDLSMKIYLPKTRVDYYLRLIVSYQLLAGTCSQSALRQYESAIATTMHLISQDSSRHIFHARCA